MFSAFPDGWIVRVGLMCDGCLGVKLAIFYIMKNGIDAERNSRGSIICTASCAGLYGFHVAPLYAATKHGVVGLVRSLYRYLDQEKIQINALAPAVIGEFPRFSISWFRRMSLQDADSFSDQYRAG